MDSFLIAFWLRYYFFSAFPCTRQQQPLVLAPTPTPTLAPTPIETPATSCPSDIERAIAKLANSARGKAPALYLRILNPIQPGKQIFLNARCVSKREKLRPILEQVLRKYVSDAFQYGQILASSNKGVCDPSCYLGSGDSTHCQMQCNSSYEKDLKKTGARIQHRKQRN